MAKYKIYFGTYSKGEGNGIFSGEFDGDSGEIRVTDTLDIENPGYLRLCGNVLYGVSETGDGSLFSVDISNPGKMRVTAMQPTHGKLPCHLCVIDNFAFAANYSEGSLSIFAVDGAGGISPSYRSIHHFGKGPNPGRQNEAHVHFADMTPDGKFLAVCDLGLDKVFLYPYCPDSGLSTNAKVIECPPGSGPRHLTFSADGEYLYILTELSSTVLVYKTGDFERLQVCDTLPSEFTGQSTCAAIHISPDGKLLGASNRGHDSIAVFEIQDNGMLRFSRHITGCTEPRDFAFSPDGNWLLAGNQNDDSVAVFDTLKFEQKTIIKMPQPVCIAFGETL